MMKPENRVHAWILGAAAFFLPPAALWCQVGRVLVRPAVRAEEAPEPDRANPAAEEPDEEYRGAADPLLDSTTEALLRRARSHIEAEEWNEVVDIYDEILASVSDPQGRVVEPTRHPRDEAGAGQPDRGAADGAAKAERPPRTAFGVGDAVVSTGGILFRPIDTAVRRQLLELPEEARELYRRTHQAAAREMLEEAKTENGRAALAALRRLAVRYPLTDAGSTAWHLLGLRLLDAGEAASAAHALEARLDLPFGPADPPRSEVLAQTAVAHFLSGARRQGRRRLRELASDASEKTVVVRGQAVGGHEVADHPLFKTLSAGAPEHAIADADSAWPISRGRFDNTAVRLSAENRPELGSHARWIFPPGYRLPTESSRRTTTLPLPPGAAAWRGLIFVRGDGFSGGDVVALDAASGKIRWRASPGELSVPTRRSRSYGTVGDLDLALHPGPGHGGAAENEALVVGIDRQSPALRQSNGSYRFEPNRLVAYGARSGKLVWRIYGEELRSFDVAGLTFTGPPVSSPVAHGSGLAPTGARLVVPAISQESFFLVGLSPSGKPRWCRRLYDHDFSSYRVSSVGYVAGSVLASKDNLVLAAPGHGLCSVVDAPTGEVLWVSRYRSRIRSRRASPRWMRPAPVITSRLAVVAPGDSDYVTALDLDTGAIVWDRRFPNEVYHVLGADEDTLYLSADRLHALNLEDGRDAWVGEPFDESLGRIYGEGFLTTDSVTLPFSSGAIGVFSTADGTRIDLIRLVDRRLPLTTYKRLFPVSGTLYAATGDVVFAIESQEESWNRLSRQRRQDLLEKALLFRAERRYEEALEIYYDLHGRYRSSQLRDKIKREVLSTVRDAARTTGDPEFLTRILDEHETMLSDPEVRRSFELLEAQLLLETDAPDRRKRAIEKFLRLAELDRVVATSPDDLEVDVAAYASDVLRELRLAGESFRATGDESPGSKLEAELAKGEESDLTALGRLALRSGHLEASALALARLVASTEADVGAAQALTLFDLLLADFPDLERLPAIRARRAALRERARRSSRRPPLSELPPVFRSDRPLEKRFWIPAQDGYLASSAPNASPAPALFAICGTYLRAFDEHGTVVFERELPDYPDVSDAKQLLQSQYEEPASVYYGEGRVVLFTPAGLFVFSYKRSADAPSPDATSSSEESGGPGGDVRPRTAEVKTLRLRWAQTYAHPLLRYNQRNRIGFGGLQLPQASNFFAECALLDADPIVLLPDGMMYQVARDSGKLIWRCALEGTPVSGLEACGAWFSVRTTGPTGLTTFQLPSSAGVLGATRFVEGPEKANHQARDVLGHLVTVFAGGEFAMIESRTARPLWAKKGYLGRVVFTDGDQVWISEREGNLRARSVRSGRIRKTVLLPGGSTVIDAREDPQSEEVGRGDEVRPERAGRTLIALGSYGITPVSTRAVAPRGVVNKVPIGQDLYVIRLDGAGNKVWESQVHTGTVVYGGSCFQAADGQFILAFNAEGTAEKWYTKLVRVDPRRSRTDGPGKSDPAGDAPEKSDRPDGTLTEVASIEINGKGTMLPPRLSLLQGAIGLGNTDGFGWLEPEELSVDAENTTPDDTDSENGPGR